jgi:hypothetical protein
VVWPARNGVEAHEVTGTGTLRTAPLSMV